MSGVASDAVKVAEYRAVLRMRRSLLQQGAWQSSKGWKAYQCFSRILSKVCIMLPPFRPRVHALSFGVIPIPALQNNRHFRLLSCAWCASGGKMQTLLRPSGAFTIGGFLLQVGEHTWGLDVKTFLGDYANWDNKGFHELVEAGAWNYRWGPVLLYPSSMAASAAASPLSWLH